MSQIHDKTATTNRLLGKTCYLKVLNYIYGIYLLRYHGGDVPVCLVVENVLASGSEVTHKTEVQ